jgi:hypothetical protein
MEKISIEISILSMFMIASAIDCTFSGHKIGEFSIHLELFLTNFFTIADRTELFPPKYYL